MAVFLLSLNWSDSPSNVTYQSSMYVTATHMTIIYFRSFKINNLEC